MRLTLKNIASTLTDEAEFLAGEGFRAWTVTLDASTFTADANGDKIVKAGQVLGKITASGLYGKYDNAAVDGRTTAVCIARNSINLKDGNASIAAVFEGAVYEARLTGLDANGKTDLANKFHFRTY
jgi:hypothetical protein